MAAVCSSKTFCPCTSTFSFIPSEGRSFYQRFVLHELCDEDDTFCSHYPISAVTRLVTLRPTADANHLQLSSKYKVLQSYQHTYSQDTFVWFHTTRSRLLHFLSYFSISNRYLLGLGWYFTDKQRVEFLKVFQHKHQWYISTFFLYNFTHTCKQYE